MVHSRTWATYETKPAGEDNANQGDDEIRATKVDIRERMALDHEWNVSTTVDGRHLYATIKDYAGNPAAVTGYGRLYTKTVGDHIELCYIDDDSQVIQITTDGAVKSDAILLTGTQEAAGVKTFHDIPVFEAGANMSNQQVTGMVIENRTNDTGCTQTGRIWYRTDV